MHNTAFMPIPDYVMNDEVRSYEPPSEAYHQPFKYGWAILSDSSKFNEEQLSVREGFNSFIEENKLSLPASFLEDDGDDLRYWLTFGMSNWGAYGQMESYEEMINEELLPILDRAIEDHSQLDSGIAYGLGRD